jgi:hypothetical protein
MINAIRGLVSMRLGALLEQMRAFNNQITLYECEVTPAGLRSERWSEWFDNRAGAIRFAQHQRHPVRIYELVLDMRPEQAEFGHIWLGRVIYDGGRHVHRPTLRYPPSHATLVNLWPEISTCMQRALTQLETTDAR